MDETCEIGADCIIPKSTIIEDNVKIGFRVTLAGDNIVIGSHVRIDPACVIGEGVTIGRGALVRAGSVVLHSVPANAIVEGNPARLVGYVNHLGINNRSDPCLIDLTSSSGVARHVKIPLNAGSSALYLMRKIIDTRGSLTVGEIPAELPFIPARYFAVFGVPSLELRGEHAHKRCQQFMICLHGSCRVLLDDGNRRCEVVLDQPDIGIFMPEMIWGTQYRYSTDAVLLVFASMPYESDDYLRTYDEFTAELKKIGKI
jgi:hypothetical protein